VKDKKIIVEVLEEVIKSEFDIENCGGNWRESCKDIPSSSCIQCCEGKKLLKSLSEIKKD
jgi:hypothetical protein